MLRMMSSRPFDAKLEAKVMYEVKYLRASRALFTTALRRAAQPPTQFGKKVRIGALDDVVHLEWIDAEIEQLYLKRG